MKQNTCAKVMASSKLLLVFLLISPHLFSQEIISLQKIKTYVTENQQKLGVSAKDASMLSLTHEYTDASTGIHHMYATQKLNGLTITNSNFSLHENGNKQFDANQLVSTTNYNINAAVNVVSSSTAVSKLMDAINYSGERKYELKQELQGTDKVTVYKRGDSYIWDIPCRLVYYNNERLKTLQPAWEVQMMDLYKKHYWIGYIDAASGTILEKKDLMMHCTFNGVETDQDVMFHANHNHNFTEASSNSAKKIADQDQQKFDTKSIIQNKYRVYDLPLESPIDSLQQPAPFALSSRSGDTLASPDGYHRTTGGAVTYQYARGNNVWAFQDPSPGPLGGVPSADPTRTAFNNGGPLGTPVATEPFVFDYPINLAADPTTYQKGAIVNLFYWNNLMHDVFYYFGFNEAAGNFEESHIFSSSLTPRGRTQGQNDAVLAQAQDGGGTNNANFLALPDGINGQMQMYLWSTSSSDSLVKITSSSSGVPPAGKRFLAVQGSFNTTVANNDLYNTPVLNKHFVIVKKNPLSTVGTETEGCSTGQMSAALPPGNTVVDSIVLIDRGDCSFVEKVFGAQLGGAAGVIIINNVDGPPMAIGGSDAPGMAITIPAVMISLSDGKILKDQLARGKTIIGSLQATHPPAPRRDGDIDNGVISHEYGHGISNRLTGGPDALSPLGGDEQGGEGWSDFVALYMTLRNNDLAAPTSDHPFGVLPTRSIGNYVTYQPYNGRGIREYPYSTNLSDNPATFAYVKRPDYSETHSVGFVWCSMLYEVMQTFIDAYGMNDNVFEGANPTAQKNPPATAKGNNIATRLVIEAMKLQPTSPTFVQERDAILKADTLLYNAQFSCRIWKAFAKRGLGFSAVSGTNALGDEVEAFDLPYTCDPTQRRVNIFKSGPIKANNGSQVVYTIKVKNILPTAVTGLLVTDTLPAGLTYVSASNAALNTGNVVNWTLNIPGKDSVTLTLTTQLSSAASSIQVFGDDHEGVANNFASANNGGLTQWTKTSSAANAFSGSKYWFAPDTDLGGSNTTLTTTTQIAVPAASAKPELVFIHNYSTESGYDGGVVEISSDGGTSYTYLPANKFVKNGYNAIIPTANNPGIGTTDLAAFSGASADYIVSVASLNDYAGKNILVRFRFTSDAAGGSVAGGGWSLDDVYVLSNRTELTNRAIAITTTGVAPTEREGTNAQNSTTSFILGNSTTLAANLGNLSAAVTRQSVDLAWKTFTEVNSASFTIERKANGEAEFKKLADVNASGNSTSVKNYKFNDASVVNGSKYEYRVKMNSRTGETTYTNIATVSLGGKQFVANIYPNPVEKNANLTIINPEGGKVTITIFDGLGKKLATFNGAESNSQVISLPVEFYKPGTYWVEVNATDNHTTLKLVKK